MTHYSQVIPIDKSADLPIWISEPPACAVNGAQGSAIKLGQKVALLGCGYMGLLVMQALPWETCGRFVVADRDPSRLALARSFGAKETYDPGETDLRELAGQLGGFDVVIEAAGVKGTIALATQMLRNGGTLNIFGWHQGEEMVPTHDWHYKGLKVLNTAPGFSDSFHSCFVAAVALMATGRIDQTRLITHRFPLSQCQQGFEVAASRADGYVKGVITFQ